MSPPNAAFSLYRPPSEQRSFDPVKEMLLSPTNVTNRAIHIGPNYQPDVLSGQLLSSCSPTRNPLESLWQEMWLTGFGM